MKITLDMSELAEILGKHWNTPLTAENIQMLEASQSITVSNVSLTRLPQAAAVPVEPAKAPARPFQEESNTPENPVEYADNSSDAVLTMADILALNNRVANSNRASLKKMNIEQFLNANESYERPDVDE